ncbi:MAG: hypothetical protein FJX78_05830 [Armatimonadetes bacterium]|nr:hypothetical protein [Armatimonadota bacterium]
MERLAGKAHDLDAARDFEDPPDFLAPGAERSDAALILEIAPAAAGDEETMGRHATQDDDQRTLIRADVDTCGR